MQEIKDMIVCLPRDMQFDKYELMIRLSMVPTAYPPEDDDRDNATAMVEATSEQCTAAPASSESPAEQSAAMPAPIADGPA
eukprot:11972177-Alexandrium_andersonii.AAC.1